jgi:hypothetical protein
MQKKDKEAIDVFLAQGGKSSGSVKVQKGDLDGAMADYDEGIGLDPKYSTAYQGRGLVKSQKVITTELLLILTKLSGSSPNLPQPMSAAGGLVTAKGRKTGRSLTTTKRLSWTRSLL